MHYTPSLNSYLLLSPLHAYARRDNSWKLPFINFKCSSFLSSFLPSVVVKWNSLKGCVVCLRDTIKFQAAIDKCILLFETYKPCIVLPYPPPPFICVSSCVELSFLLRCLFMHLFLSYHWSCFPCIHASIHYVCILWPYCFQVFDSIEHVIFVSYVLISWYVHLSIFINVLHSTPPLAWCPLIEQRIWINKWKTWVIRFITCHLMSILNGRHHHQPSFIFEL